MWDTDDSKGNIIEEIHSWIRSRINMAIKNRYGQVGQWNSIQIDDNNRDDPVIRTGRKKGYLTPFCLRSGYKFIEGFLVQGL